MSVYRQALTIGLAVLGCISVCETGHSQVTDDQPYIVVLGIAQDGGAPQAGNDFLDGDSTRTRRAVSLGMVDPSSGERWMFEATPDFPEQLRYLDRLAPRENKPGLDGIFLTHAHMGHYTGLMYLGHEVIVSGT